MPNIFHQSVEDILKAATPEQRIIWNDIFLRYGERASISQFIYSGTTVGTELLTYVARKLYFAYEYIVPADQIARTTPSNHILYDPSNSLLMTIGNNSTYWDATAAAARHLHNSVQINNIIFSRIVATNVQQILIIGYRIIY